MGDNDQRWTRNGRFVEGRKTVIMDSDSARGVDRRRLLGWGGLAAAGVAVAGVPLVGVRPGHADPAPADAGLPPDTLPGGAYDRYLARLAAEGRFSGVVVLSHRGRTVLSRSYGMADREKGIRNHEGIAVSLSSAAKPFCAVAVLQLVQQGRLRLTDTVGTHLTGFPAEIADQVTVHHMLSDTSGLETPEQDLERVFQSREEVREYNERWTRQARLVAAPGTGTNGHSGANFAIPVQIVEAVTGMTYWDYLEENIFRRAGMTGSAFCTRPQWLTDKHIAHSYMTVADGSQVDAVRNLDQGSPNPYELGKNPGRNFIDYDGFATAPDLVRFTRALYDGTVLDRVYGEVLTAAKLPHAPQPEGGRSASAETSYGAYLMAVAIVNGQWLYSRAGVNPGSAANWSVYPHTDWVGVVLSNSDSAPLQEILQQETLAVTGAR
ncbi:serine hydrolase domain-containing protein [Umezawaea sp. Da 62-37]|uniref:serine hydrolase domain-containing protein n=1 Tax=Umezawaea sp. Da 62-37 TaxID=3075927 RepID=UPI0028F6DB2F|nr:serine hydrolase domain-containing protein [Umezawaea sp. Da 62-37]WNV87090.1 serine hydrolase domain-containing protein [Umezawaea sp. Da 62-37]